MRVLGKPLEASVPRFLSEMKRTRVRLMPWIRLGISAAAAACLFWRLSPGALRLALWNFDAQQLLPALSCAAAMLAVRAYKWHQLLDGGTKGVQPRDSFRSLLGGFALGVVIPGRLGELGRCLFSVESDRPRVALLNLLDRALDSWALLTCGVASLFLVAPRPVAVFGIAVWLAALPLAVGLPTLISALARLPRWPKRMGAQLAAAASTLTRVRTPRFAILSLGSTCLDLMLLFFLLRGFQQVDFAVALATFPWIVMAGGLPISLSGLGVREGAAALLLARYALPPAAAVNVALLLFLFSALLPAALGGIWLLADRQWLRTNWSSDLETLRGPA